jgi:diguanylate cyclase (GGDEF)-like protein
MVSRERLLFAAQILFAGLHELAGGEAQRAGSLELLIRKAAAAAADEIPNAIVDTVIDFTGAEFAYIALLDDIGVPIAEASTLKSRAEWWRILSGMGQWVVHAEEAIEIPNVSESAWCRHLAGSPPPPAAVFGAPLMVGDRVFGAVVIGGAEMERLEHWRNSLTLFTDTTADAMLLCRRLLETGEGDMIDRYSGTYNLRFLEELLEKEISRAGRHNHELSVVLFRLINYPELIKELGPRAAEQVLVQMAELLRNNTRKVNSLARVGEAAFALVIPEADQIVAQRIADELRTLAQSATLGGGDASGKPAIKLMLRTRTVSNPSAVETALDNLVSLN